jgi:hypothetical protein
MPSTRAKRKADGNALVSPPKEKMITLGAHLAKERAAAEEVLLKDDTVAQFEPLTHHNKLEVIAAFGAEMMDPEKNHHFRDVLYAAADGVKILFLTLQTEGRPQELTHVCNNSHLSWNLRGSKRLQCGVPSSFMIFVRGEFVEGTSLTGDEFLCLGVLGIQSTSMDSDGLLCATFIFDYQITKKEMLVFGDNCLKCKKNRYGCSLCA